MLELANTSLIDKAVKTQSSLIDLSRVEGQNVNFNIMFLVEQLPHVR